MTYDVILADPPWQYTNHDTQQWAVADKFYTTLADSTLLSLPVADLLNRHGVLFMWATCPRLDIAMDCVKAWGLHHRGVGFVWVKTKRDGTPIGAQGVRPTVVKPLVELVLVASKIKTGRPMPLSSESVCQTIFAPKREHSRKPDEVRERIDALYPTATKLEMFSRGPAREGWDLHGDEKDKFGA